MSTDGFGISVDYTVTPQGQRYGIQVHLRWWAKPALRLIALFAAKGAAFVARHGYVVTRRK